MFAINKDEGLAVTQVCEREHIEYCSCMQAPALAYHCSGCSALPSSGRSLHMHACQCALTYHSKQSMTGAVSKPWYYDFNQYCCIHVPCTLTMASCTSFGSTAPFRPLYRTLLKSLKLPPPPDTCSRSSSGRGLRMRNCAI